MVPTSVEEAVAALPGAPIARRDKVSALPFQHVLSLPRQLCLSCVLYVLAAHVPYAPMPPPLPAHQGGHVGRHVDGDRAALCKLN